MKNMGVAATRARLTRLAHLLSVVFSRSLSRAPSKHRKTQLLVRSSQGAAAAAPTIHVRHGHRDAPYSTGSSSTDAAWSEVKRVDCVGGEEQGPGVAGELPREDGEEEEEQEGGADEEGAELVDHLLDVLHHEHALLLGDHRLRLARYLARLRVGVRVTDRVGLGLGLGIGLGIG